MAQEALAIATPGAEEMTTLAVALGGSGVTGLAEGVIIRMAPVMGAAQPIITWGTLLGVPLLGGMGALFTRGMIGDLFKGVAAAGIGILGYSLPALIAPFASKQVGGNQSQGQGSGVKQLPQGVNFAPQRAQAGVRATVEF
ncbi:hypothetical protein ES703_42409 [subsurface metagenome]